MKPKLGHFNYNLPSHNWCLLSLARAYIRARIVFCRARDVKMQTTANGMQMILYSSVRELLPAN
jgi:hypothetical protein